MSWISFENRAIYLSSFIVFLFLLILNLYYQYTGNYFATIPIVFQTTFIVLFSTKNIYYRKVGLFLFGLIAIGGVSGLVNIGANGLLASLDSTRADYSKFELIHIFRTISFLIIGSFFFISLLKTNPTSSNTLSKKINDWKNFNFRTALRDAALIRLAITLLSFTLGILLALVGKAELTKDSSYILIVNFIEHFLLTIGISISLYFGRSNLFSQAILLGLLNWIFLLPFILLRIDSWLISFHIFFIESIIAIAIVSMLRKALSAKGNAY